MSDDLLSEEIHTCDKLVGDSFKRGEERPLWRDFAIAAVSALRLAKKAREFEAELSDIASEPAHGEPTT